MGRPRTANRHLPQRMCLKHGAYYHVTYVDGRKRWTRLAPASDYGAALRAWAEIEGGRARIGQTVRDAVHAYIGHIEALAASGQRSAKTAAGYRQSSTLLIDVLGDCDLTAITDQDIRRYRTERGQSAPVAANREIALLSAAYGHAAELGWIASTCNPCRHVKRNTERPRQRYITDAELARLLHHAPTWMQGAIRITACTGIRVTDLLRLRLSDITADGITITASKTGKRVLYTWTDELHAAVDLAKSGRTGRVTGMYLFHGKQPGRPLTLDGLETAWARVRTAAGIEDVQWRVFGRFRASTICAEAPL